LIFFAAAAATLLLSGTPAAAAPITKNLTPTVTINGQPFSCPLTVTETSDPTATQGNIRNKIILAANSVCQA
jgi:hypothetical protein